MHGTIDTRAWIADEARALLARVGRVRPLVVQETMAPAAAASAAAQRAIDDAIARERRAVDEHLRRLLAWLEGGAAARAAGAELQQRLVTARMRFNDLLTNVDVFVDALGQRSERDAGLWLAGLDVAAADLLALPDRYQAPPVLCFLDRGPGAAIRRARTRLPGGGSNPVALIQIPRERMTGSGIAASLAHETGHQAAALIDLVASLRDALRDCPPRSCATTWPLWQRWLSEIVADLWALARLGPSATLGLMGVLSLPRAFVWRVSVRDPHPAPWLRVKLSVALGHTLYPDPQWRELEALWDDLYPIDAIPGRTRELLVELARGIPELARRIVDHRPVRLGRARVGEVIAISDRAPAALRAGVRAHRLRDVIGRERPGRALALLGQARWLRAITPEAERRAVSGLLASWATRRALGRDPTTSRFDPSIA